MASRSTVSCDGTAEPNWDELPRDITANIFQRLDTIEIVTTVRYVCPIWWNMCKDPLIWRTIRMTNVGDSPYYDEQLLEICYYAIKQSCGHLEYISIENFATDDLLEYIAEK
ncbi:unnamed protein product [Lathyrus sativus]|nr:unnamed protein product [Lathyrus sativus]